jgi:U3 small nucleolar RNA-associated protein 10
MFDWAVLDLVDDGDGNGNGAEDGVLARQIVLFKTFNALSTTLRSLVSSYYAVLLDQVVELLGAFATAPSAPVAARHELWRHVIRSLHLSATHDEGAFWTPARVVKVSTSLFAQLAVLDARPDAPEVTALVDVTVALVAAVHDEATLKHLNSSLLARASAARANSIPARRAATQLLAAMWAAQPDHLLSLVPETVAQLAELLDDDDDLIVRHANTFRAHIETALGESLESYLT